VRWLPGVAIAGIVVLVPPRLRVTAMGAGAASTFGVIAGARQLAVGSVDRSHAANQVLLVGVVAGGLVAARWFWELVHRLESARRREAQLAVAAERLRFAADLHDIQGHHLQVIALKSELASRLSDQDPAAAATQMAQVQEHARNALADTRAVVQGYRQTPLAEELTNATRVLEAAGIDGRLDPGALDGARTVDGSGRQLLGAVVREATTNILRHSHAHRARLTLNLDGGHARLAIHNDGATTAEHPPGTGLADLRRRLDAAGGSLQWRYDDGWFSLTTQVPIAASALTGSDCPLTDREPDVLRAARTGDPIQSIAEHLHLAPEPCATTSPQP
jgi:two-component system, NarL family, sensor histidine kinase DesK